MGPDQPGGYDLSPRPRPPEYPRFAVWSWVACGASGLPGTRVSGVLHKLISMIFPGGRIFLPRIHASRMTTLYLTRVEDTQATPKAPFLTLPEVIEATGATRRQILYWKKRGYITTRVEHSGAPGRPPLLFDEAAVGRVRELKKRSDELRKGLGARAVETEADA